MLADSSTVLADSSAPQRIPDAPKLFRIQDGPRGLRDGPDQGGRKTAPDGLLWRPNTPTRGHSRGPPEVKITVFHSIFKDLCDLEFGGLLKTQDGPGGSPDPRNIAQESSKTALWPPRRPRTHPRRPKEAPNIGKPKGPKGPFPPKMAPWSPMMPRRGPQEASRGPQEVVIPLFLLLLHLHLPGAPSYSTALGKTTAPQVPIGSAVWRGPMNLSTCS